LQQNGESVSQKVRLAEDRKLSPSKDGGELIDGAVDELYGVGEVIPSTSYSLPRVL